MIKEIFLVLLFFFLLFVLYRFSRSYKPKVIVNPEGKMQGILARMHGLEREYKPTPWLINAHIQTMWGMKFRGRSKIQPRRETVNFEDGGEVYVDWFENESTPENAPILFIVHTLGGGTREPCTNWMAVKAMRHGWRALVATCRGCNGSRITTKRLYDGIRTDDLHTIIKFASKEFPKSSHKYLMGYSLGSMISVQYANDFDDVEAVMCVSHPIETEKSLEILEKPMQKKLYMPAIMHALTHVAEKDKFIEGEQREKSIHAKTIRDFDDALTSKELGLASAHEYYEKIRLEPKIAHAKVPLLIFNSDDDPFTSKKFIPVEEIKKSQYAAYVHTPEGGHVSFNEGMDGKDAYIETFAINFFETVSKAKTQN